MSDVIREASDRLRTTQGAARTAAASAAQGVLERLRTELGADLRLQGLPNLASSNHPYRALPVRRTSEIRFSLRDGQRMLVLTDGGDLVYASMERGVVTEEHARPEDLMSQDLELLVETVAHAIKLHLQKVERKRSEYDKIARFAEAIERVLSGGD
jgi:hypothetical protein